MNARPGLPGTSARPHRIDVIGDIHGQLGTLRQLGRYLGYAVEDDWSHPDGRVLVFLGDLVDRGEDSLGVCQLVHRLVDAGRAVCLMGNHEYNLVGWYLKREKPEHSNRSTIADVEARRQDWEPVLRFLADLPLALELPELRVIHAVWHDDCFSAVASSLRVERGDEHSDETTIEWLRRHVVLRSPFEGSGLRAGLSVDAFDEESGDSAHEVLIKGYERSTAIPFNDADGKERTRVRATWWTEPDFANIPTTVFGHYWNLPPVAGHHNAAAPPEPSGHPRLQEWQQRLAPRITERGVHQLDPNTTAICVDYNGIAAVRAGSCIGAYRWPEHQVAWVRTTGNGTDEPTPALHEP